jgi:hypothetical protein
MTKVTVASESALAKRAGAALHREALQQLASGLHQKQSNADWPTRSRYLNAQCIGLSLRSR